MKYYLTIAVDYDPDTVDERLEWGFDKEVDRAIQDGMLTPTGGEVIEQYSMEVLSESDMISRLDGMLESIHGLDFDKEEDRDVAVRAILQEVF